MSRSWRRRVLRPWKSMAGWGSKYSKSTFRRLAVCDTELVMWIGRAMGMGGHRRAYIVRVAFVLLIDVHLCL